jgi:hypothetical protein
VHSVTPTFMGVVGGAAIWAEIEAAWDGLLDPDREPALVEHLAARLSRR